jgi:Domain of unknown function (DUF5666)
MPPPQRLFAQGLRDSPARLSPEETAMTIRIAFLAGALALASATAEAQTNMRVRGTITAIDGNTLMVKSREGKDLTFTLPDNVGVAVAKAIKFEDIKPGDYVGSTATKRADGMLVALEVHYLPPQVPSGNIPWDLAPNTSMVNANVEAMVNETGTRELTLKYKDGTQKVMVPEGVPLVRAVPGARSDLRVGEYVFLIAQVKPDGKMVAPRIQVSKDGVKPPQ